MSRLKSILALVVLLTVLVAEQLPGISGMGRRTRYGWPAWLNRRKCVSAPDWRTSRKATRRRRRYCQSGSGRLVVSSPNCSLSVIKPRPGWLLPRLLATGADNGDPPEEKTAAQGAYDAAKGRHERLVAGWRLIEQKWMRADLEAADADLQSANAEFDRVKTVLQIARLHFAEGTGRSQAFT